LGRSRQDEGVRGVDLGGGRVIDRNRLIARGVQRYGPDVFVGSNPAHVPGSSEALSLKRSGKRVIDVLRVYCVGGDLGEVVDILKLTRFYVVGPLEGGHLKAPLLAA